MSLHTAIARLREASFGPPAAGENPNTCRVGRQDLRTALQVIDRLDADLRRAGILAQGAEPVPNARVAGEAVAWMHEEDQNRVLSAQQKAQAERDGGAYASSLRPYSIPLARYAAPQAGATPSAFSKDGVLFWYGDHAAWRGFNADLYLAPQASEPGHGTEHAAHGLGDVVLPRLPPITHEWAALISDSMAKALENWARAYTRTAILADRQQRAEDADRWRWATAIDENAQTLHSIVLCHGGDQQKINERADFYRAALSAQPAQTQEPLPTEEMIVAGFEAVSCFQGTDAYKAMAGCQQAAESAKVCWAAMIEAMPEGSQPRQDVAPTDEALLGLWAEALWPIGDICESKETVLRFVRQTLARFGAAQKQGGSDA